MIARDLHALGVELEEMAYRLWAGDIKLRAERGCYPSDWECRQRT